VLEFPRVIVDFVTAHQQTIPKPHEISFFPIVVSPLACAHVWLREEVLLAHKKDRVEHKSRIACLDPEIRTVFSIREINMYVRSVCAFDMIRISKPR
jgi:hypothetical protein